MSQEDQLPDWQSKAPPPAEQPAVARIAVGRVARDAFAGLRARFGDVMALAAILVLPPAVLLGFVAGDPDMAMIWLVLANLPVLAFEGAVIRLTFAAMAGMPPPPVGETLRVAFVRLSQLFSIFALTFSPILLAVAVLSLIGQTALLAASPLVAVAALALKMLLIAAPALVMLEGLPAFPAMRLSVRLTRGNRWRLILIVLIIGLLEVITFGVTYGAQALVELFASKETATRIGAFVAEPLITLVAEPLGAALVAATYLQLRRIQVAAAVQ